jgi:uncharacterized SAM-binding protein YcdF (DUF218 family)
VTYIEPALPFLLLLGFLGIVRTWQQGHRRPWLQLLSLTGITVLSTQAGARVLAWPLEHHFSKDVVPQEPAEAIVVLSGTVSAPMPGRPYSYPGADTYRRVQHALFLFRNWKAIPILVSGGGPPDSPHAEAMRRVLQSEGVPSDMIWMETRSDNTHENAVYSAEILRAKGISRAALVIEASSMLRAARSFEKNGVVVVPAPTAFTQMSYDYSDWLPAWQALRATGIVVHEMLGLAWYKWKGWI